MFLFTIAFKASDAVLRREPASALFSACGLAGPAAVPGDALRYAVAVWLARAPERDRPNQQTNSRGPVRRARERLVDSVRAAGS